MTSSPCPESQRKTAECYTYSVNSLTSLTKDNGSRNGPWCLHGVGKMNRSTEHTSYCSSGDLQHLQNFSAGKKQGQMTSTENRVTKHFFIPWKHWNSSIFPFNLCLVSSLPISFASLASGIFFLSGAISSLHLPNSCPRSNSFVLSNQMLLLCCFQLVHNLFWSMNQSLPLPC